jgi:short-subunit dehydrogenase
MPVTSDRLANPESVLITGATGGIGTALSEAYATANRTLVLQGRNGEKLDALAERCRQRGAIVEVERLDLRDTHALTSWLAALSDRLPIDLAIVNAGVTGNIGTNGDGETWTKIDEIIDVNLRAALATVDALLPRMRARGSGQIALISSLSAYFGLPLTPSYCASKAALKAYGEALRGWLAPEGIAVNVVLPGFVESNMSRQFPGPKAFVVAPERAAQTILRGLAADRARISFPFPMNLGLWSLAAMPPALSLKILALLGYATPKRRV